MYKQLIAFIITIACLFGFIPENEIYAEQQSLPLPFNVQVQTHSLQDKDISSYFKLDVSEHKGQTLTLQVAVKNITDETINVRTEIANALTSTTGGIDYNPLKKTEYASFINEDFAIQENITGLPEQLILKGNETKLVEFQVEVPEDSEGTYLAGVSFLVDYEGGSSGNSISVNSVVGRTIAVQLDVSEASVLEPEYTNMEFTSNGGVPIIRVQIENHSKMIHPGVNTPYTIYKKDTMEKVFSGQIQNVKMAPSTKVLYQIQWQGTIEPGNYIVKIGEDSEFKFKVDSKTVETIATIQGFDVKVNEKGSSFFWWILILLIILNLLFLLLYLKKKREANKAEKQLENDKREREMQYDRRLNEDLQMLIDEEEELARKIRGNYRKDD